MEVEPQIGPVGPFLTATAFRKTWTQQLIPCDKRGHKSTLVGERRTQIGEGSRIYELLTNLLNIWRSLMTRSRTEDLGDQKIEFCVRKDLLSPGGRSNHRQSGSSGSQNTRV
jgi:hypothetical protein